MFISYPFCLLAALMLIDTTTLALRVFDFCFLFGVCGFVLQSGAVSIVSSLHKLPASVHDRESFVADVMKVTSSSPSLAASGGGLLVIVVRGTFLEDGVVLRSFHRTFLCTPPTPEARAKTWPVSIIHDTLYIGAAKHTGTHSQAAAHQAQQQQSSVVISVPTGGPLPSTLVIPALNAADQALVQQLATQTGITFDNAKVILFTCQGDINAAMNQVAQLRAQGQI